MVNRMKFPLLCASLLIGACSLGAVNAYADGDTDNDLSIDDIRAQLAANVKDSKSGDSAEATTVRANGAAASPKIAVKEEKKADLDEETKRLEEEEQRVLARMQPEAAKPAVKPAANTRLETTESDTSASLNTQTAPSDIDEIPDTQFEKPAPAKTVVEKSSASLNPRPIKAASPNGNSQALSALKAENEDLKRKIEENETKSTTLLAQLEEARNRLIIAETEVERLSSVLEARNNAAVGGTNKGAGAQALSAASTRQQSGEADDMPIATVTADKAQLRAGPSMSDSPLMAITKGTRLAVETRRGDWLRVISPAGTRAWVNLDVVSFGTKK